MRKLLLVLLLVPFIVLQAQIYEPQGLNMPGAYDGWSDPPTVANLASATQASGNLAVIATGTRRYHTTFSVASSGADLIGGTYEFLFTSGSSSNYFSNKWGGTTVAMNTVQSYSFGAGTNNSITLTNGMWYTVNFADSGYKSTNAVFMETSAQPVTITNVSDNYSGAGNDVLVNITLSGAKSTEEHVFIRYTTDGWATSSFIEATGSGTDYSATIPGSDINGTADNSYYVMTTTFSSPTSDEADMETINLNNNSGTNYALPVELTSFTALTNAKAVTLKWNTATELNNFGFSIERKSVNSNWAKIGFVHGSGNSNSPKDYSYVDNTVSPGKYSYRLKQIDNNGTYKYSKIVEVNIGSPASYALDQNYPNPFNPSTTISYALPAGSNVKLVIYNSLGQEVRTLVNGFEAAGIHKINFNALNMTSGMYFYKIEAGSFTQVRKMILLK